MRINILSKGDKVVSVTSEFIAIERKSGEVDLIPLLKDNSGLRIDQENIVTIGFGNNTVQTTINDVVITTF